MSAARPTGSMTAREPGLIAPGPLELQTVAWLLLALRDGNRCAVAPSSWCPTIPIRAGWPDASGSFGPWGYLELQGRRSRSRDRGPCSAGPGRACEAHGVGTRQAARDALHDALGDGLGLAMTPP